MLTTLLKALAAAVHRYHRRRAQSGSGWPRQFADGFHPSWSAHRPSAAALLCLAVIAQPVAGAPAAFDRIVFGGDANYPPFEWLQDGRAHGFNVELARALLLDLEEGITARHELGDWPAILEGLDQGRIDAVPMFHSEAREARYLFTDPIHHADHAIFGTRSARQVTGVDQLAGFRVAVESRSYAYDRLSDGFEGIEIIAVGNTLNALLAVDAGTADYTILSAPAADHLIRAHGLRLERIGPTFWPRAYAFAVRRDRADLAAWLNLRLQQSIADGRYGAVYESWKHQLVPGGDDAWARWLAAALLAALALAAAACAWVCTLRRTVAKRTADLRDELDRRRSAEAAARYMADFDQLGMARPHLFRAQVAEALARQPGLDEILVMKLGAFEHLIRTLDFDTGMKLAEEFAQRLRLLNVSVCGRLSRDVFALLFDSRDADRLLSELSRKIHVATFDIFPNLRIGRAQRENSEQEAEDLIRCAEIALWQAIERHRFEVRYDPSMRGSSEDLKLVGDFQATDGAGMFAHFQPILDIGSGRVVGAEALARWHHPELGSISPARFVPLLEQAGLINIVTERMMEEALRVAGLARRLMPSCCISVNVTPNDLVNPRTQILVDELLHEHHLPAQALKLELTETSVVDQPDLVRAALQSFEVRGVGLSVDDFGTGHSSLTHLTSFPFSELKIDREFVSGLTTDSRRRSIVRSTLLMAKELGLAVVAEGVEDQRTLTVLRHLKCDRAQGFGISKPLPESEFLGVIDQDCLRARS